MTKNRTAVLLLLSIFWASPLFASDWQGFGADTSHTGVSDINFPSGKLKELWNFSPSQHVWNYEKTSYEKGNSVWGSSLAALEVEGKKVIFAGYYDHNLYAIEAESGLSLWRYATGGALPASPCAGLINGTPTVFIGSGDRTVYAINAKTGKKIWSYETEKWDYTTSEAIPSSGILGNINGKASLFICMWNNNYQLMKNIQKGEMFCFNATDGKLAWRKQLANVVLNSPALTFINKRPVLFITGQSGCIWCLDATTGQTLWSFIADASVHSSPSIIKVKDKEYVCFGTRFGNVYALSVEGPRIYWTFKTGHAVDATIASAQVNGKPVVFVGSHDRSLYCLDAESGRRMWSFATENFITASSAIGNIKGKPAVFINSLDDNLYCLDAGTGNVLWKYKTGKLIWKYTTRGDTIWSSPVLINAAGGPLLLFASYDGNLYCFGEPAP